MIQPVKIGEYRVGPGAPCFIAAEAGVNHNGDIEKAHLLIEEAARAGANAIKFQSFITEDLVTPMADKALYQKATTGESGSQFEMLKKLELSFEQQAELKRHCDKAGILYLCTPYETKSADMLEKIGVAAIKIASTDANNIPFLRYLAPKKIPVILSTGMSMLGEIEQSVNELQKNGLKGQIVLLHCTSEYPAPIGEVNLRAIQTMQAAFKCPVGFSDHTEGIGACPWSVAAGACFVEKHFTLDRSLEGPDHRSSIEPHELQTLVQTIREVESALGDGIKRIMDSESRNKARMQKSIVTVKAMKAGDTIRFEDLTCKRPGTGIPPGWIDRIVGRRLSRDVPTGQILTMDSIQW